MPAIAAVSVLAIVVGIAVSGGGDGKDPANAGPVISSPQNLANTETSLTIPQVTVAPVVIESVPIVKTDLKGSVSKGSFGDDVRSVQKRLAELGFAPGQVDGQFGSQTQQAVWAYEKLILRTPRADATGKVTNDMWHGMQDTIIISPRRPGNGTHVEIYLPEQVAIVFTDNAPTLVLHISSGTGEKWCELVTQDTDAEGLPLDPPVVKDVCGISRTPGGVFHLKKMVQGDRVGPLGRMFNPVYFNFGIAIHGAKEIPLHPASHGCIRIHRAISDTFQNYVQKGNAVFVWGEDGREPESYSKNEMIPPFNVPNPDATTTTTTVQTTTTVPTTTKTTTSPTVPTTTTVKVVPTTTTSTAPSPPTTTTAPAAPTTTTTP